ncbi:hypothetical protein Golax_003920, partial [Gossypium laxum]|nr:hypothetical protein [Gossypium laxum]
SIGNGNNVRCWVNAWVPNVRALSKLVSTHANINLGCKLSERIMENDLLRDYPIAKDVWLQVIPQEHIFFSSNLTKWKHRNLSIFQGISMDPNEIIKVSFSWAKHFFSVHTVTTMTNTDLLYSPSIPGTCIYLNVGGVVQMNTGLSIASGVIRDEMGKWILGYNWFLGKSSVFIAELWGILDR